MFHKTTPDLQDQDRFFWSQTGLVLRPTVSDHITDRKVSDERSLVIIRCQTVSDKATAFRMMITPIVGSAWSISFLVKTVQNLFKSVINSFIHSFCKKQLTERNCTIKLENWLKYYNSSNIDYR